MTLYYAMTDERDGDAVLRRMLKTIFGVETLQYTAPRKPWAEGCEPFSFAHSGALALLLTDEGDCGVDAEPLDGAGRAEPEATLTARELQWLQDQVHNYMTLWTRKDAARKAAGDMEITMAAFDALERDNRVTLNGKSYCLGTFALEGHVVSWASQVLGMPQINKIDLPE